MNIRRYVLPSALILLLGLGVGVAQNINRALQLSQDSTGSFGVDSNLGVYFPGHMLFPLNKVPGPSISGNGTPVISGTDYVGLITMGTSSTTATALFGAAFITVPYCTLTPLVTTPIQLTSYIIATTSIAITQASNSGNKYIYNCPSAS